MQLTIPSEPATAVSTAINTLSNLLQLTCFIGFLVLGLNELKIENYPPDGSSLIISHRSRILFTIICGSIAFPSALQARLPHSASDLKVYGNLCSKQNIYI